VLPCNIHANEVMEFPLEAYTERNICGSLVEFRIILRIRAVYTGADTQEDIGRIASDALVVRVGGTEAEEVKLRHHIHVDDAVLPFGVQFLAADGVVVADQPLSRHFGLHRPALGELIAELHAVSLPYIHADMRSGIAYVVSESALNTHFAQVRTVIRTSAHAHAREQHKEAVYAVLFSHYTQIRLQRYNFFCIYANKSPKIVQIFVVCAFLFRTEK